MHIKRVASSPWFVACVRNFNRACCANRHSSKTRRTGNAQAQPKYEPLAAIDSVRRDYFTPLAVSATICEAPPVRFTFKVAPNEPVLVGSKTMLMTQLLSSAIELSHVLVSRK